VVRPETVTLWVLNQALAVVPRDHLRAWLRRPRPPLTVDEATFLRRATGVSLSIGGSAPYPLPPELLADLAALL
jgi:hypothetical protein